MESTRTILVIDDIPMFRELQSVFLARTGRVLTAGNGPQGLELARGEHPDLILLDLLMPGMDGEEVCQALKSDPELKDIPVVMLLSSTLAEDHARAVRAGADGVLLKPLTRVDLLDVVNRCVRFSTVRGLPRVPISAPVRFIHGSVEGFGTLRNLSRGGLFMESEWSLPLASEVQLDFVLPETSVVLTPTARVVWHYLSAAGPSKGMGLRFVGLDAPSARCLEDYIFERSAPTQPSAEPNPALPSLPEA